MLSNLSNNNSGNATKSVVEKKHYEAIESRLDEMQDEIEMTEQGVSTNSQAIASLDGRVDAVENNSTFPTLNTDTINPATGDKVEITSNLDVDGEIEANSIKTNSLSVNGTNFTTVKNDAAQAKSTAETAKNKADEAYDLADAVADELADYKADNEASITTGTLNADSVVTDSIAAQTINTNDFETTNAEIDKLYVDTIKATGFLELPTSGQSYYTITVPAKTTASFSGVYTSDNNTDYPFYFTVSDGAVIYKQNSTEIIKDISFDRETGYTKVRVKSSTNLTYISSALDSNPVTIEDGGDAYADYAFIPQKTGGYLIRGYDDTTTEVYIAGVLRAYAMSVEEEIIERTSVDFLKVNASVELPKDWDAGGTISYSTGEENQYISAQKKAGVTKPTWTSPIHSTIGSLSYSSKLVDEATVASYKGISETRQTQTISITEEASLQQLTAFHWTKNGNYWQPYEVTRITIGDNTMWIDPTEANQGIRFYDNQVIADGTWNDVPVEEANAVPVNLVIFDAPTELSFPITNLGDKTTVHGEITATCFKGNVLGNVTGNADTATNATCFDNKTYAEAKADILSGKAASATLADLATNATCFDGKTYAQACANILSGNAATATNANNADNFDGKDYATVKADILSGNAASATNATCFDGHTYACAKADILSGNAASATNATCFDGCTYAQAKADILSGCAADSNKFNNKDYATACADILKGKACTSCLADCACTVERAQSSSSSAIPVVLTDAATAVNNGQILVDSDNKLTYTPSTDTLCTGNLEATADVKAANVCGSTLVKGAALCSTGDLNVDGDAYITGDLTVQGTITTTHSEEVVTPSENIILRDGATTPIASGCYSGFIVTDYDGSNNLEVGADKDGTLHVGVVGGTMEPIATRATEACMENGYAAHWDSTGTDLVTKGATNTHDLCINGDATATGTITGTFSGNLTGNVTGNVTGNLTGNADTATNATCFDGCTYACAKKDILSGCAADSNKLAGKTYAQTKTDILSGNAASASYATKVVPFCDAADEEKNLAFFNSDVTCGYPNTIQYDSGKQLTFNPVSNNLTVAGDVKAKNAIRRGEKFFNLSNSRYILLASASMESSANHDLGFSGRAMLDSDTVPFDVKVRIRPGSTNNLYFRLYSAYDNLKATYTRETSTTTIRLYIKAPDTWTTAEAKIEIDAFTKGNLYPFASTYDSALTLPMTISATMTGTEITTTYMKVESSTNADNATCFNGCTYAQACSDIRSGLISDIGIDVNCGSTCVCTLNNGSTLALSANAFNENATISTDTYPGVCCTGTSNYVVTTMVCCAKGVCRNQATTGTCHLALFDGKTAIADANMYVSNACELTYSPATGVLKACTMCTENGDVQDTKANVTAANIAFTVGQTYNLQTVISCLTHCYNSKPTSYSFYYSNNQSFYIQEGGLYAYNYSIEKLDNVDLVNSNWGISKWAITACNGRSWTVTGITAGTADSITWKTVENVPIASCINTSSCNAEYPLVFSTCCATPAAGNRTLYNDSANNLMYNPSTNTLTACCIRGASRVISGNPLSCTSTQTGSGGVDLGGGGIIELYHATPFIDFHVNNTCADFSHRLIANNGYLRVTATNATGCTAATQTANFDFCSNGTFSGACTTIAACTCTMFVNGYNASTNNHANLKFRATCCDATTRCNWNMCLCGADGKLYNPQGFCGPLSANCVTNACWEMVPANTVCRKALFQTQIQGAGYISCAAIGQRRGASGWGSTLVSAGCNDAGTLFYDYDFTSTGTVYGVKTMVARPFIATASTVYDLTFSSSCTDSSTTVTPYYMCLCGCNGKLYNPQGFMAGSCPVALICDIPSCVACAGSIYSSTTNVEAYNCAGCQLINVSSTECNVAIGFGSCAKEASVAIGYAACTGCCPGSTGLYSVALGFAAATNCWGTAIGSFSRAFGRDSVAVGFEARVCANCSMVLGYCAYIPGCPIAPDCNVCFEATVTKIGCCHAKVSFVVPKGATEACTYCFAYQILKENGPYKGAIGFCPNTCLGRGVGEAWGDVCHGTGAYECCHVCYNYCCLSLPLLATIHRDCTRVFSDSYDYCFTIGV